LSSVLPLPNANRRRLSAASLFLALRRELVRRDKAQQRAQAEAATERGRAGSTARSKASWRWRVS
jgi:hypothetical protein